LIMPCGYGLPAAAAEFRALPLPPAWHDLPAVRDGRVFVVEASGYFSRPGPRLAEGMAILAAALHAKQPGSAQSFELQKDLARVARAGN
jgi:iron complex transport system substrate-binding protein